MKKTLIFLIAFVGITTLVNAQNEYPENVFEPSNIIKIAPFRLLFNNYQISYESLYKEKRSLEVVLEYEYTDELRIMNARGNGLTESAVEHEIGIWSNYRFYTSDQPIAGKGFYFGPSASYTFTNLHTRNNDYNYSKIGLGGIVGYQIMLGKNKKRIFIDINITPQYQLIFNNERAISQVNWPLSIKLGYRFKKK